MRALAPERGRKLLLLLAGGWAGTPASFAVADGGQSSESAAETAFASAAAAGTFTGQPLLDAAGELGYTIFPVDVPGNWTSEISTTAAESRFDPQTANEGTPLRPAIRREQILHSMLTDLAEETGGVALLNAERTRALSRATDLSLDYYWLGFSPPPELEDRVLNIQVTVDRPRLTVKNRRRVKVQSSAARALEKVESALRFDNALVQHDLGIEAFPGSRKGRRRVRVPIEVRFPLDGVAVLPGPRGFAGQVEISVLTRDEAGNRAVSHTETVPIEGGAALRPGDWFTYRTELVLKPRPHRVVVQVHDPSSGANLVGSYDLGRDVLVP